MTSNECVAVFGASGHTGRFVASELERRGLMPVLIGRSAAGLADVRRAHPGARVAVAALDDRDALASALASVAAVINCAGPFLDTASELVEAAIRARVHYLDVTAEQASADATLARFDSSAAAARISVVPAAAFYGGLADVLASALTRGWSDVDSIDVAIALDRWWPTAGTRATGRRNTARRFVVEGGARTPLADPAPRRTWAFPDPFGEQAVVALPFSEIVTIASHLRAREIHSFLNLAPLSDLADPDTPPPGATDASGRSGQTFAMEVVARRGAAERRAIARGRDIYAVTAPIVVEAARQILSGRAARVGTGSLGELFEPAGFLASLGDQLAVERRASASGPPIHSSSVGIVGSAIARRSLPGPRPSRETAPPDRAGASPDPAPRVGRASTRTSPSHYARRARCGRIVHGSSAQRGVRRTPARQRSSTGGPEGAAHAATAIRAAASEPCIVRP